MQESHSRDFSALIRKIARTNPFQMSVREYSHVAALVSSRPGCRLLVFGVGKDSCLWLEANAGGRTTFLEDSVKWAEKIGSRLPGIDIRHVEYNTRRSQWREMLERSPESLFLELPDDVRGERWDVILVDGPASYASFCPGRMRSLSTASVLAHQGREVDVIVHDCNRRLERSFCDRYFEADLLVDEFDRTRHYRTGNPLSCTCVHDPGADPRCREHP